MTPIEKNRAFRTDLLIAGMFVVAGLAIAGMSLAQLRRDYSDVAQVSPAQTAPEPADQARPPAESRPGGTRPTIPAPEPARPDADAQKAGATPSLPPAPAENSAAPIRSR